MSSKNLSFSLIETSSNNKQVTYESLMEHVNEKSNKLQDLNVYELLPDSSNVWTDDHVASELHYDENYTKKQLDLIADYYEISKRKKRKSELIEEIVIFERESVNYDITQRRKTLWFYMDELHNDSFLSKFLILD